MYKGENRLISKGTVFQLIVYFSIVLVFLMKASHSLAQQISESSGDLHFKELPDRWDEGLPLGNGMVGALVWQQDDHLRLSLDRADLWDLREVSELKKMTFDWVQEQVQKVEYDTVQQLGDAPYQQKPYPTKIQAAGLNFDTDGLGSVEQASLYMKPAEARLSWSSGASLTTFVHADKPVGWFRFKQVSDNFKPILDAPAYSPDQAVEEEAGQQQSHRLADLGYEQGEVVKTDSSIIYTQPGWDGMLYQVAVRWKNEDGVCTGVWSITSRYPNQPVSEVVEKSGSNDAEILMGQAFDRGFARGRRTHRQWWNEFWARSSIKVPDTLLQRQYEREMYKFGAAARQGAPPITLQAVWTADNGSIPPWKGDFHHDLNTQLSYWPGYAGNHLALTRSFTDWLWNIREENKEYTRWYFEADGLNVPGVTTLTGRPMGGWIQYSMSPTISAWLAQHFYWQWSYSQDEQFLRERAYPYLRDAAVFLEDISFMEDGKRTLPLSSSPEIHNNSIEAWFSELTNYDLALIKNAFGMAVELAGELGKSEEQQRWEQRKHELPGFTTHEETGLLVAPGEPLENSHRHFSHLMAIHPLGLLDPAYGEDQRELINKSLEHLDQIGTDGWTGYSFSWQANLYARAGKGEKAAEALQIFASNFVSPNSFHLNGDQKGGEYSNFTYRPFTLEGNFAFASGLQEMLMQSNTGIIEVFPAIPDRWSDLSFQTLRAQGAFLVSAEKEDGKIIQVTIESEQGGPLQVTNPFESGTAEVWTGRSGKKLRKVNTAHWKDGILQLDTNSNETIKLLPISR